jgi:hypothetical protein
MAVFRIEQLTFFAQSETAMFSKLMRRWHRHSSPPAPPKREDTSGIADTSSMADLVRLLEREKEPAE